MRWDPEAARSVLKPTIYQVREGKREAVRGSFKLERNREIGFTVDAYDHNRPLVIDPVLSYATYLGGSAAPGDYGTAIAVDATGSAYVAGYTYSSDFPLAGTPLQTTNKGLAQQTPNVFVTKFSADGASLVYSTYLGGSGQPGGVDNDEGDLASGIAVDSTGSAFVTGTTFSKDFPVTSGAFQSTFPPSATGISSSFVSKISASGDSLEYSTYLGGSGYQGGFGDSANAIAIDSMGAAYVTGTTASTDFPVTSGAFQAIFNQSMYKVIDGYVAKLKPDGSALEYGTFFRGTTFNGLGHGLPARSP